MALSDYKILGSEINTNGVVSAPDILTGTTQENKAIFDKLPTLIINKFNALIDSISATGAGEIGSQPFDEITANNIQDALKQIRDLIGTYYSGADGAGKVGYTPSEGVDASNVQAAIEAVQANLAAYIAKIKAATGAAEVGNAPIAGMTATNVQQALEELRNDISDIVAGSIPAQSITSDMIQDGAVTADKLGSDVTGDTIPTSASDPTSISSQLSNLAGGKLPKTLDAATEQDFDTIIPDAGELKAYRAFNPTAHLPPGYSAASCDFFVLAFCELAQLYVRQLAFDVRSTAIWTRRSWDDYGERVWDDWQQVRTSDAPEVYTFPAAAGISGDSQYCKTQDGMVLLFIDALNTSEFSDQDLIGTMPVGFRPANNVYTAVAATESDGGYVQFAELGVDPDGDVTVYMSASKPRLRGFIMFPA